MRILETICVALAGGALFTCLHFPLTWMLGPLTGVLVWQTVVKRKLYWPVACRNGGQVLLGYSMGLAFTAESARQIVAQLPSMLISTLFMIGFGVVVAFFVAKRTGINLPSSVIGTTPGGLSQMVLLSEEIQGADATAVTLMQTVRMLTVVFVVPSLAVHGLAGAGSHPHVPVQQAPGTSMIALLHPSIFVLAVFVVAVAILAARFKFPTPWIMGPLIVAAVCTVSGWPIPSLPQPLLILAQCSLGIYIGLSIKFNMLGNWKRLLPYSIAAGVMIVLFAFAIAYVLSLLYPMNLVTSFLSIAPGGIAEMGVTAHMVHADVSLVAAYQLFRVLFILFIVPIGLRWVFKRHAASLSSVEHKVKGRAR